MDSFGTVKMICVDRGGFGLVDIDFDNETTAALSIPAKLARRIVACWNACAGIPVEQLECDNVEFARIFNERNELQSKIDALLPQADALHLIAHAVGVVPGSSVVSASDHVLAVISALKLYDKFFEESFAQCCSNGLFDAWGRSVDCTTLNYAHYAAEKAFLNPTKQTDSEWSETQ